MKNMKAMVVAMLVAVFTAGQAYAAVSNEAFASQVERELGQLGQDKAYEEKTKSFCRLLSTPRQEDEPKCVALQLLAKDRLFGGGSGKLRLK